ncbi:MAG: S-adenosylmethionine:tRNA ribosyltransferase-isomerase [Candidatus Azobacteroides sp.]|nr:S-adenosylmethionine:tRNA ribosyltransferase-isomerase [Candidatus Azobacteroides sp.]
MTDVKSIRIDDFDYELPDDRIAKFPLSERDKSKLLVWKNERITESSFLNLSEFIPEKALLVFNNTQVIQARLIFRKKTGAPIEIFCLEPKEPSDYAQALAQSRSCTWLCLVGNAKRWKEGKLECVMPGVRCTAERINRRGETHLIRFEWDHPDWTFADVLEKCGELPIPPYLNRKTEASDKETYQTIYSKVKGSVAAPTAGLHFTEAVFQSFREKKIEREELTLHVGAGTFKPVKSKTLAEHEMHSEWFSIKKSTVEQLIKKEGQVFAVGTTSVRTLESLYYLGLILEKNPDAGPAELTVGQWTPYPESENQDMFSASDALKNLLNYMERNHLETLTTHTQILIAPGYSFKIVNGMITNFHQPKSTLLLLISAFVGDNWRKIYDYALANDFRFLSYGDSSLLFKNQSFRT